jgi:hypothetical protein
MAATDGVRCRHAWALLCCAIGVTALRGGVSAQEPLERGPWPRLLVVRVTTETVGSEAPVPETYSLWINGDTARAVPADGELRWALPLVGPMQLQLRDLGPCDAEQNPRTHVRPEDLIADTVIFRVTCVGDVEPPPRPRSDLVTEGGGTRAGPAVANLSTRGPLIVPRHSTVTLSTTGSAGGTPVLSPSGGAVGDGAFTVVVDSAMTYVLTVTGPDGSAADSVTIDVFDPPEERPRARLRATPPSVWRRGAPVRLTMETEHADSAVLSAVSLRGDEVGEGDVKRFRFTEHSARADTLTYTVERNTELRFTAFGNGTETDAVTVHVPAPKDTVVVREAVAPPPVGRRWWWGPGLGGVVLLAGSSSFGVPFLSVAAGPSENWYGKLQMGLRPSGAPSTDPVSPDDPRPEYQDRRVKLVSFSVLAFPTADWWGLSLAYAGAWETVSGLDYYTRRAHGPSFGVRGRWPRAAERPRRFHVLFGVDLLYSNVSRYDETVSEWRFGVAPSMALTFAFD